MGLGDDIMAAAEARSIAAQGHKAFMGPEWSPVFENNPDITKQKTPKSVLVSNRIGHRPYIKGVTPEAIIYNEDHRAPKGVIVLTDAEKAWARQQIEPGYILVEPHIKGSFAGNKAWIWDRWVELAKRLPVVQCKAPNKRPLPGARVIETESVRQAFALLAQAKLIITTDGALHHAAAALGVPAVVLWGARTHPNILGYEDHANLYTGQGESCGMMSACNHCREAMRKITVDQVYNAAIHILNGGRPVIKPIVYTTEGPWSQIAPYIAAGSGAMCVPAERGLVDGVGIIWGLLRGSPELIAESRKRGQPFFHLDHGYFKRSDHMVARTFDGHYRVTLNGNQQSWVIDRSDDRWKRLGVELKPWRKGQNIVVCPSSDHFNKCFGLENWEAETVALLKQHTDRPIVVRRKDGQGSFAEAMADAHAVVTSMSLAAVEAVTMGVPVFVGAGSAAAPVGLTDYSKIESPLYPEREPWARSLAYGQFTRDEMKEGLAWSVLKDGLQRSTTP